MITPASIAPSLSEAQRAIQDMAEAFADTAKASWHRNEALVALHAGQFAISAKRADAAIRTAIMAEQGVGA